MILHSRSSHTRVQMTGCAAITHRNWKTDRWSIDRTLSCCKPRPAKLLAQKQGQEAIMLCSAGPGYPIDSEGTCTHSWIPASFSAVYRLQVLECSVDADMSGSERTWMSPPASSNGRPSASSWLMHFCVSACAPNIIVKNHLRDLYNLLPPSSASGLAMHAKEA